jgi:UDP:flavonoid glycosyltransferase YjiC (YdhE family)
MAVPPDLVGFAEAAGFATVAYGPELQAFLREDFLRNFWTRLFRNPIGSLRELWEPIARYWEETSTTLMSLADGADLLSTGLNYEQPAANVAEYYDIPLITLHHFPIRRSCAPQGHCPNGSFGARPRTSRTRSDVNSACRRQRDLHHAGSLTADRWKSRPTTRFASPVWLPSGRNGTAGAPLSARSRWS